MVGLLVVGRVLGGAWPRPVRVEFQLDPSTEAISVDYVQDGIAAKSARFTLDPGSRDVLVHELKLAPGHYEVQVSVIRGGSATEHRGEIDVPADRPVRLDLTRNPGMRDP